MWWWPPIFDMALGVLVVWLNLALMVFTHLASLGGLITHVRVIKFDVFRMTGGYLFSADNSLGSLLFLKIDGQCNTIKF